MDVILYSKLEKTNGKVTDLDEAVYGYDEVIGHREIDNSSSYIGVYQSKIDLDVKKGDRVVINVGGTAFNNQTVCTLYFYLNDDVDPTSQGAIEIGKDKGYKLSADLKGVAIYALPVDTGSVSISVKQHKGGIAEISKSRNFFEGEALSGYWTGTTMTASTSYGHTPPIKLTAGDYLFTSTEGAMGMNGKTAIIVDAQGNPLSSITGTSVGSKTQDGIYNNNNGCFAIHAHW